jgi:YEATS domain-containing protein 4
MPVDHTHSWTISVAGVDGADITHFIKKVQFKLHADTYANPTRSNPTPLLVLRLY